MDTKPEKNNKVNEKLNYVKYLKVCYFMPDFRYFIVKNTVEYFL